MSTKKNLVIDIVALIVYLVVANPALTGIGIHEWLGIGICIVFLIHCVMHASWVVDVLRGGNAKPSLARQGNLIVDVLILVVFMVVTVSGIGVSGTVLPALGLYAEGYYFWDPLHAISAKILLALIVIHLVVHWKWVYNVAKSGKGEKDAGNGI